jgi:glycine C-acetyltransferase
MSEANRNTQTIEQKRALAKQLLAEKRKKKLEQQKESQLAENFGTDFQSLGLTGLDFKTTAKKYSEIMRSQEDLVFSYMREVTSAAGKSTQVYDPYVESNRDMLMFGSNNYFDFGNHAYIKEKVLEAVKQYGVGFSGPPVFNGYTRLHAELEEKLAALKGQENAMLFSSGYAANLGLASAIASPDNIIVYDELSHASLLDGIELGKTNKVMLPHSNIDALEEIVAHQQKKYKTVFVAVEGVYSMDGDICPLDKVVQVAKKYDAMVINDDAHGTGVMGAHGCGTAEHFGVEEDIDIAMGTFSKVFATTGGFLASSHYIIDFLRGNARSYIFSASPPPAVVATVLAGLELFEKEPEHRKNIIQNLQYFKQGLAAQGIEVSSQAPIVPLLIPQGLDIHKAIKKFHELGIFLNAVTYPTVPRNKERFRISLMSTHTKEDIDKLLASIEEVWTTCVK